MNDNSAIAAILDNGTCFTLFNNTTENDMPYGTFALTLVNNDYGQLRKSIEDVIHLFFDKPFNSCEKKKFVLHLHRKIDSHISFSSKGYLHTEQALMITELIVIEILNKIEALHFDTTDIEKCIPIILYDITAKNLIKEILLRNSDDLASLMQITNTFEINSQLFHMKMPVYYLNTISDYLLLDLKMYLEHSSKTVKECERCKRLYLPTRRSDKYCRLPIRSNRKTCAEISHISSNDKFAKARNNARDKQHKTIRYYYTNKREDKRTFLLELYTKWSEKCGKKCVDYKIKDNISGFEKWIERTMFTSKKLDRILQLYKIYEKSKPTHNNFKN